MGWYSGGPFGFCVFFDNRYLEDLNEFETVAHGWNNGPRIRVAN